MYNSHIVGVLASIWTKIVELYEDSLVDKILKKLKRFIIYITKESKFIGLFRDRKKLIENSFFNRSYEWVLKKYNRLIGKANKKISEIQDNSQIDRTIDSLLGDYNKFFQTILVFIIFFFIGILGQSLIYRSINIKVALVSLGIIGLSAIILNTGNDMVDIFKNSCLINIFLNLISSKEEGSGQWW